MGAHRGTSWYGAERSGDIGGVPDPRGCEGAVGAQGWVVEALHGRLCPLMPGCPQMPLPCCTGDRAVLLVSPCRCEVGAGGVGMWLGPLLHPKGPRVVRSSWGLCHGGVPRGRGHRLSPTRRDALGEDGDAAPTNWVRGRSQAWGGETSLFVHRAFVANPKRKAEGWAGGC